MRLGDALGDRQSEAGARHRQRIGVGGAVERGEDVSLVRRRDAQPGVGDVDDHVVVARRHGHHYRAILRGVLHGVVHHVVDHPGELLGIAEDHHRGRRRVVEGQGHPRLLGTDAQQVHTRLAQLREVDSTAHGLAPALDAGVVQEVGHQVVEPLGVADDRVERGQVGVSVRDQLGVAQDRGQRGLELVGDGRDELAAVARELAQLLDQPLLGLQHARGPHDLAQQAAHLEHGFCIGGGHRPCVASEAEHRIADEVVARDQRADDDPLHAHRAHQLLQL